MASAQISTRSAPTPIDRGATFRGGDDAVGQEMTNTIDFRAAARARFRT